MNGNEEGSAENTAMIENPTEPISAWNTTLTPNAGDHGEEMKLPPSVFIYAGCAAFNSANLGFICGVNTGAAIKLQNAMNLTDGQVELFIGILLLFSIPGALSSHFIGDRLGRRGTFIVAAIGFILGIGITCTANNYGALMFSRVWVGIGIGLGFAVDPIYIAEISPAAYRGRLVTWSEIGANIGIVLGFLSGIFFHNVSDDIAWRGMYGLGIIMPTIMIFLACFVMPESPRWLVQKDRNNEAKATLNRIYPPDYDVDAVIKSIQDNIRKDAEAEHAVGWGVIFNPSPAFKRMLLVGFFAVVSQKLVGIDAIQYYLIYILEDSGIEDDTTQFIILTVCGLVKLGFVFVAGRQLDRFGRRVMLLLSCLGMSASFVFLAFIFFSSSPNGMLATLGIGLYLMFFSLGMGPGAWLIPSEVFANTIRTKAMSLATSLHFIAATIMSSTFLSLSKEMSYSGNFILLAAINLGVAAFFYFLLPETMGLTLEDMSHYFAEITGDRSILEVEARGAGERPVYDPVENDSEHLEEMERLSNAVNERRSFESVQIT